MAKTFWLTEQPIRLVGAGVYYQPIWSAVDVSEFDIIDIEATIIYENPTSPQVYLDIYSSMSLDDSLYQSWVAVWTFYPSAAYSTSCYTIDKGFFKYLRWINNVVSGVSATVFFLQCTGRKI